uniref:Uncharacterized protein n=1 Tax=mine drainage metagenome TaxID=410659 RepID=E6Q3A5_9ZZZZ
MSSEANKHNVSHVRYTQSAPFEKYIRHSCNMTRTLYTRSH